MAEQQGEKSQDATPHRRQQAREKGQVPKSADINSAVMLLGGAIILLVASSSLVTYFFALMHQQLGEAWIVADQGEIQAEGARIVFSALKALFPMLFLFFLLGLIPNLLQTGILFIPEKVQLDISNISVLKGLKRLFSISSAVRLGFGMFKLCLIAGFAGWDLWTQRQEILSLAALSPVQIAVYLPEILIWTAIKIGVALLILAILDYAFQRWKFEQDLKMTTQEVREEMKNLQGDPQIIARRRAVQRQLVLNRLSSSVPKADVVVTNPTELAVAIQYDIEKMAAPIVVAKGAGLVAQRIRLLALEQGIPIVEKKPLAQALFKNVEINHPIPEDLYAAVAELLAYVYDLQGRPAPKAPGQRAA